MKLIPLRHQSLLIELIAFTLKEALACTFAVLLFTLMLISHLLASFGINRYDFIFLGAVGIQAFFLMTKKETVKEFGIILVFHLIGLALELFKTHPQIRSWSYPEPSFFRVGTVPLYSGFMYAAVGSYVIAAWKLLHLKLINAPAIWISFVLALLGYINFFTKHFYPDLRWWIIGLVVLVFARTKIEFTALDAKTITLLKKFQIFTKVPLKPVQRMISLNLAFLLIAFFIYIAENIATLLGAWQYPNQNEVWHIVHPNKISSWFLLFIISFLLVVTIKAKLREKPI